MSNCKEGLEYYTQKKKKHADIFIDNREKSIRREINKYAKEYESEGYGTKEEFYKGIRERIICNMKVR